MTDAMWVFPGNAKVDVILPDGTHRYWSTHCRHGNHSDCAATEIAGTTTRFAGSSGHWPGTRMERKPAQCKTCAAPCLCHCHQPITDEEG